jgi:hypothetical protein
VNCCFAHNSSEFPVLLRFYDAQFGPSFHPLHRHPGPVAGTWRRPFPSCESLLLKHQALIVNRCRQRSPNLSARDRVLARWMALLVRPTRLPRFAIVLKPSTLLNSIAAIPEADFSGPPAWQEHAQVSYLSTRIDWLLSSGPSVGTNLLKSLAGSYNIARRKLIGAA